MKKSTILFLSLLFLANNIFGQTLETQELSIKIEKNGQISSIFNKDKGKNLLLTDQPNYLIRLRVDSNWLEPSSLEESNQKLAIYFENDIKISVKPELNGNYISFEIVEIDNPENMDIELVQWGPIGIAIKHTVGETLGVVYDDEIALGLLTLNIKTIGAWPMGIESPYPSEKWQATRFEHEYCAAWPIKGGAIISAYCRDYSKERIFSQIGYKNFIVQPLSDNFANDRTLIGSKIAIYSCKREAILDNVEEIVVAENLPRPTTNGEWNKRSGDTATIYFITNSINIFNVNKVIDAASRMGGKSIYSEYPFLSMGEFKFLGASDSFYRKNIIEKAGKRDLTVGTHMISNFVSRHDKNARGIGNIREKMSYVTSTRLKNNLGIGIGKNIELENPEDFSNSEGFLLVDNEMIHFIPDANKPGTLRIKRRGIQRTLTACHKAGAEVKLYPYEWSCYKIMWGNIKMNQAISRRMADIFNNVGIQQMSWDGLEGGWHTGYGAYAENKLVSDWYNSIDNKEYRADGSRLTHFTWHTFGYVNWGETHMPFRINEPDYRYRVETNYPYYVRNFFPQMFGWCGFYSNTTLEETHWLGSKLAAYNVGAAIRDIGVFANPRKDKIFDIIREWTIAKKENVFDIQTRTEMAEFDSEWELTNIEPGLSWNLVNKNAKTSKIVQSASINYMSEAGVEITSSSSQGNLSIVADKSINQNNLTNIGKGSSWIAINLGKLVEINRIRIWRDFEKGARYKGVVIELADNPEFSDPVQIFNNDKNNINGRGVGTDCEYAEKWTGTIFDVDSQKAQFIRIWSAGSNLSSNNLISEIQILSSKPADQEPLLLIDNNNSATSKNLALTGMANSSYGLNATRINDNSLQTFWTCDSDEQTWIEVDIGKPEEMKKIVINWGLSKRPASIKIQSSSDGKQYFEETTLKGPLDPQTEIAVKIFNRRYIRVVLPQGSKGISIAELEIHN
ncbi:MAG: discoidin domain-containing protein [Spirochaetales bacterium]|nr:discoidin domain-containing protein [Spirochaetales bacterium]